ncbi:MAG: twin-arginine translocase TatA/TatE family subunit [Microgenomates group bacterium]
MGTTEILIIAFLVLIFLGGKRVPEFIKSLGQSVKEFKESSKEKK